MKSSRDGEKKMDEIIAGHINIHITERVAVTEKTTQGAISENPQP